MKGVGMKKIINSVAMHLNSLLNRLRVPAENGDCFVSPMPTYISQFVDIYPQSIATETILDNLDHIRAFGAQDSQEFTFWAWRDCGIACVKMILDAVTDNAKNMMELTKEGIQTLGFLQMCLIE